jgi:hypothetical protein
MTRRGGRGVAVLAAFLLFLPFMMLATSAMLRQHRAVTAADVEVQMGLQLAAKSAGLRVSPLSQANGDPRLRCDEAHATFRQILAVNLGLDQSTLNPLSGSPLAARPDYVLAVYNGDGTYVSDGAPAGVRYSFVGGTLSTSALAANGFPQRFGVGPVSVVQGSGGNFGVTLDRPGLVATVRVRPVMLTGGTDVVVDRWIAAKVVRTS